MKHSPYIAFSFLLVFGYLLTAHTPIAPNARAQEAPTAAETEVPKERPPVYLEKLTIILEGEEVLKQEGVQEWAGKAAKVLTDYYPYFDKLLETEGFMPEKEMSVVFRRMDGVAFASGSQIVISADWIRRQPGDLGMVAHELVHVIQRYPGGRGGQGQGLPGWLMEGLTDYIRHAHFEPEVEMRPFRSGENYDGNYQITAAFLMYIVDTYDKDFITALNEMGRNRTYSADVFEQRTGKTAPVLWAEYDEKVRQPHMTAGTRMVPAQQFPNLMKYKQEFEDRLAALKNEPPQPAQPAGQGQRGQGRQRPPQ